MNDLIWVGNTLYPRWIVFAAMGLTIFTLLGISCALQMLIRRLQQRDGKNL